MALLAAIALDLGHRHAVYADGCEGLTHLVQLERFDDGDDEFHGRTYCSPGFSARLTDGRDRGESNRPSLWANGTKNLHVEGVRFPSRVLPPLYRAETPG